MPLASRRGVAGRARGGLPSARPASEAAGPALGEVRMSMLSLNVYVLPLAVARLQGHGRTEENGDRELQLQLDARSELHVRAQRAAGGWVASATLREPGET